MPRVEVCMCLGVHVCVHVCDLDVACIWVCVL